MNQISVALTGEKDLDTLIEMIMLEAKVLTAADGGTIYLKVEEPGEPVLVDGKRIDRRTGGDRRLGDRRRLDSCPPEGMAEFQKTEGGFEYSYQLVEFIKRMGGFSIGTAGFPEGHIACKEGKETDWARLKAKIDSGADFMITQLFFDNRDFFLFRDHMAGKLGVTVPIFPGILPILSAKQIKRFTALCGARIPAELLAKLEALGDDDEAVKAFGIDHATLQCKELLREGVPGLHLYTLNKTHSTTQIVKRLGLA